MTEYHCVQACELTDRGDVDQLPAFVYFEPLQPLECSDLVGQSWDAQPPKL